MQQRVQALLRLGGVVLLGSVALGAPWTGYEKGLASLLFRVGIIYVMLGAVTARSSPATVRQAIGGAAGALAVTFLVGTGTMYYDLGMTPPEYGTPLTVAGLVTTQAVLTLLLVPVSAAYVCGVLLQYGRGARGLALFGGAVIGGWFAPVVVTYIGGTQSEFAALYYFIISFGTGVAALPMLMLVNRRTHPQKPATIDQPTS
ncbi:hypothetical protein [Halorussus sp. AFM4]|uniref:hypothetical protein n=1 Tax=Halorussus sp. AFM4 TaxID=3421651 RepID=UPI003EBD0743